MIAVKRSMVVLTVGLSLAAVPPCGAEVTQGNDPGRWGSPAVVLPPVYPELALRQGRAGSVDINGVIAENGRLEDVHYTSDSSEAADFIAELKEVIPQWSFYAPLDDDCLPRRERVTTTVWFEVVDGKPKISVSRRTHPEWKGIKTAEVLERILPKYPRRMMDAGVEATVYSKIEIEPSGRVESVKSKAFELSSKGGTLQYFERATSEALSKWRFKTLPEGEDAVRVECQSVTYRFRD